jgi:glycosyltransferase involved in cell wall biosynthesis
MLDLTVAIRTHNGEKLLPKLLELLKQQIETDDISWEVIVIDNNSTDCTAQIIAEYQFQWQEKYPLKYYFEPQQGAANARKRAIQEAKGALIGFLDDDNLPREDWVIQAYRFGKAHPEVGAYGGRIHAEFESNPPENFQDIAVYLAIVERGDRAFCFDRHKQRVLPPGAGIVISRRAWKEAVPDRLFLLGPNGSSLSTKGEDMEFLSYIQNAGWEIWYNPDMHIDHTIPSWRMERDYLLSLAWGSGLTRYHIRTIRLKLWQYPLFFLLYPINDLRKVIVHFIKYHKELKTNIVLAFQMNLLLSILISPLYISKIHLSNIFSYNSRNYRIKEAIASRLIFTHSS